MSGWMGQPSDLTSLLGDPTTRPAPSGMPFGLGMPSITAANASPADAASYNAKAVQDYITAQRAEAVRQGLWDENTGMPTGKGLVNAAQQYGGALLGSTAAPGEMSIPGVADRISTRVPTSKKLDFDPHQTSDLIINRDAIDQSGDAFKDKAADLIAAHPGMNTDGMTTDQAHDAFVNHVQGNLTDLYNAIPAAWRDRATQWYDGANAIANRWAQQYGYQPRQVAGTLAALSPQRDWFQNVELGNRVLDIARNHGDEQFSPEMNGWLDSYVQKAIDEKRPPANIADMQATIGRIGGKSFNDIQDPYDRAMWLRAYDGVNNPSQFRVVSPEGDLGDFVTNKDGTPSKLQWGSNTQIGNALSVLDDGSLPNISQAMGGMHKVRNFYNNIVSPNAPQGDVTVDTHAIAAGLLRPLGSSSPNVAQGLGLTAPGNNLTGANALYGLYADAYRDVADKLGLQPRQLQSATWEGIRQLFPDVSRRNKSIIGQNEDLWRQVSNGQISPEQARQQILAPGIGNPDWFRPGG